MTPEAIVLALANAVRPTGIAAVYALLSSPAPKRVLSAYIAAGFAWSVAAGVLVVGAFHGVDVSDNSDAAAIFDVIGGVACLGFAAGMATGRLRPQHHPQPSPQESRLARALKDPSLKVAAGAGVATHLPGLFYLLGLNAIAAADPGFVAGVVDVLIFNAIWFSGAIASLVMSVRRPQQTREAMGRFDEWMRTYERAIVATLFAGFGAYFALKGGLELLG